MLCAYFKKRLQEGVPLSLLFGPVWDTVASYDANDVSS
jgi:hypothetical protein